MPLAIRFVRVHVTVDIPVLSRTEAEAHEIARDVLADKMGIMHGDAPTVASTEVTEGLNVADDETVWGEAVPEEAHTVALCREWLSERQ